MADKKTLGIFWGKTAFDLIETSRGQISKSVHIPFDTPIDSEQSANIPDTLKFTSLLQKAIGPQIKSHKSINLSLPAKDLIYRSFVIPSMEANEVKNVVEFEVTKYIPLQLDDLVYTFHPEPVTDNNVKKLHIYFVGIRKDILERYTRILQQTGLQIGFIEPSSVSLVRVLKKQNLISDNRTHLIINVGKTDGKIVIVHDLIIQFVREFAISAEDSATEAMTSKLINDVRLSMNYFVRQNPSGKINKIIVNSILPMDNLVKELSDEFKIQTIQKLTSKILPAEVAEHIGLLNAYGITLREKSAESKNFDLSDKSSQEKLTEGPNYKNIFIPVGVCFLALFLTFLIKNNMLSGLQKELADLKSQTGKFEVLQTQDIKNQTDEMKKKYDYYLNIETTSNFAHYMIVIPQWLPPGTWLDHFDMQYNFPPSVRGDQEPAQEKRQLTISLEGRVYLDNTREQFRLVNDVVAILKEKLHDEFKNIDLLNISKQNQGKYTTTVFRIICK